MYETGNQKKIEVLRINVGDQKAVEKMGKAKISNKVAPLNENTILKATSVVSFVYLLICTLT